MGSHSRAEFPDFLSMTFAYNLVQSRPFSLFEGKRVEATAGRSERGWTSSPKGGEVPRGGSSMVFWLRLFFSTTALSGGEGRGGQGTGGIASLLHPFVSLSFYLPS